LRGRSRQQIIEAQRAKRTAATPPPAASEAAPTPAPEEAPVPTTPPLEECLDTFWQPGPSLIGEQALVQLPEVPESVLRRLGPPPFWRGEYDVMVVLTDAYRTISREAYALAHPEKPVERPAITPIAAARPAQPSGRSGAPTPSRPTEPPDERPGRRPGGGRRGGAERPAAAATTDQPAGRKRPSRRRWPPRPRRTEPPGPAAASGGA
jgi:hypothetical protein